MKQKMTGFKEFERILAEEMPKATARNTLTRAAVNSMEPMRIRMAALAPHDPLDRDEDGNHLNETMRTQVAKAGLARKLGTDRSRGVLVLTGPAPVGTRARSNAGWQEDGTVKMPANPYARPAADAEAQNVIDRIRDELALQIGKTKARMAKKAAKGT